VQFLANSALCLLKPLTLLRTRTSSASCSQQLYVRLYKCWAIFFLFSLPLSLPLSVSLSLSLSQSLSLSLSIFLSLFRSFSSGITASASAVPRGPRGAHVKTTSIWYKLAWYISLSLSLSLPCLFWHGLTKVYCKVGRSQG
jgi:hypothetical protein